jgi:hypothetical protein
MLKTVSSITNAIGALNYVGTWNASTNTPALASGVGTKGDYYQVSVAGSTSLNGISNWGVGDVAAFNGTTWQRIEGGADLNGVNLTVTGSSNVKDITAVSNAPSLKMQGLTGQACGGFDYRNPAGNVFWQNPVDETNWYLADADFSAYVYLGQNFTGWTFASDRRLKDNIADVQYGLNAVMQMQPRSFTMKSSGKQTIGFIAQELHDVVPEAVSGQEIEFSDTDTNTERAQKTMGVSKELLIPVLVKAIQELKSEFDAYKASHP